jgi:ABC-type transport system substrate-binding protein
VKCKLNGKGKNFFILSTVLFLTHILTMTSTPAATVAVTGWREPYSDKEGVWDPTAGYADELYFKVFEDANSTIQALQSGEIDMIGRFTIVTDNMITDPNIEINSTDRRGFFHLPFNCNKFPTNYTELRQAFAHALDKEEIQITVTGVKGSRYADSPIVPALGKWSLDNQEWSRINNYYEADPVKGNEILDAHGWVDRDDDGYREDPNGETVVVEITAPLASFMETIVIIAIEAYESIHIKARADDTSPPTMINRVKDGDFNMAGYAWGLSPEPILWPGLERLMSTHPNNFENFNNATYDALVETAFESFNMAEVEQAIWDAQKILWYEQPMVVAYQNLLPTAYRKDPWIGWVNALGEGVTEEWTYKKIRLKPEYGKGIGEQYEKWQQGGRFTTSTWTDIDTTNIFNIQVDIFNVSHWLNHRILGLMYDGLHGRNPYNLELGTGVAKDWLAEEIDDPTSVRRAKAGDKLKITYYLHEGMTFHDGRALTAEDVAFTYELASISNSFSNNLENFTHVEVVNTTMVEIFCNTASVFNLQRMGNFYVPVSIGNMGLGLLLFTRPILPKHVWENINNPLTWDNPYPVGSGAYKWKSHKSGELVILERNDDYFYNPRNYRYYKLDKEESNTTETSSETSIIETTTPPPATGFEQVGLLAGFVAIVLVVRKRRNMIG